MLGPGAQQSARKGLGTDFERLEEISSSARAVRMLHLAGKYFAKEVRNKNSLRLRPELIKNDKAI